MRRPLVAFVCLLGGCWIAAQVCLVSPLLTASAQEKSKSKTSKKKGNTTVLDVKANEIQGGFIKSAEELAGEYYELKEFDRARMLLKSIQALDPNRPNLESKLKLLDEDMINSNGTEVEINSSRSWESSMVMVSAGKPIRIKADGNYKFVLTTQLGPTGFTSNKTPSPHDLVNDLPVGALIGIVIPPERLQAAKQGGQPVEKEDEKKKDKPFLIGDSCDHTSPKDGVLYLRVNAPPDNKNNGKIKVLVSGGTKIGK
ncbi:MAG: hypothetical protein V4719_19360 [Planctomycetota bacterium]